MSNIVKKYRETRMEKYSQKRAIIHALNEIEKIIQELEELKKELEVSINETSGNSK